MTHDFEFKAGRLARSLSAELGDQKKIPTKTWLIAELLWFLNGLWRKVKSYSDYKSTIVDCGSFCGGHDLIMLIPFWMGGALIVRLRNRGGEVNLWVIFDKSKPIYLTIKAKP